MGKRIKMSAWSDPEPMEFEYLDKVYSAPWDMPSPLFAKICHFHYNVANMEDEEADKLSVELLARVFHVSETEAATIVRPARRTMLGFLANGLADNQATTPSS